MIDGIKANKFDLVADELATNLNKRESELLDHMRKPAEQKNEAQLEGLKLKYQQEQRVMTLFSELMKNMHEMLMSLIRSLRTG